MKVDLSKENKDKLREIVGVTPLAMQGKSNALSSGELAQDYFSISRRIQQLTQNKAK